MGTEWKARRTIGEQVGLGVIAVVLGHSMPSAQPDLALLVAAPILCSPVGVSLPEAGALHTPPVLGLTDLTPM